MQKWKSLNRPHLMLCLPILWITLIVSMVQIFIVKFYIFARLGLNYVFFFNFLTVSSPAFKAGVERVSTLAGVGPHPDPKFRLSALAKILKTTPHPEPPPSEVNLVQQPSDVLELLFVQDLRDLQTKINEALVAVQTVTADPRTDTTLGRVGR